MASAQQGNEALFSALLNDIQSALSVMPEDENIKSLLFSRIVLGHAH